jgi:hypothetical protein
VLRDSGLTEVARRVQKPEPTDRRQFHGLQLLARKAAPR